MGTRMAQAYANKCMTKFVQMHLPHVLFKPLLWKRFFGDILAIFICQPEDISSFETWINSLHLPIKFTMNSDTQGIPFLDTHLTIEKNQDTDMMRTLNQLIPSNIYHQLSAIPHTPLNPSPTLRH